MSCSTALGSNSYRVGGGSSCFPLVGTRDPPITHPASSGGELSSSQCIQCFPLAISPFFRFDSVVIGPFLAEVQMPCETECQFLFSNATDKESCSKAPAVATE